MLSASALWSPTWILHPKLLFFLIQEKKCADVDLSFSLLVICSWFPLKFPHAFGTWLKVFITQRIFRKFFLKAFITQKDFLYVNM
jgi:hypothetical protein